ncbi:MAG: hypothetical protein LBP59_10460 [Planctomycetaceae bacterium]|nr:hypothetical protein [Planctomycetaceae bacterium]
MVKKVTESNLRQALEVIRDEFDDLIARLDAIDTTVGQTTDPDVGHDHDGENSKKIEYENILNTPTIPPDLTGQFNATSGHDHDGENSKKIEYENILNTPTIPPDLTDRFNATSGHDHNGVNSKKISYNDLTDKPDVASAQVNADWAATSGVAQILNKPTIPAAIQPATAAPQPLGTAAVGTSVKYAKEDHVHRGMKTHETMFASESAATTAAGNNNILCYYLED